VKFQPKYVDKYIEGSAMQALKYARKRFTSGQVATPFFYGVNTMRVVSNEACEALLHCHSLFYLTALGYCFLFGCRKFTH